MTRKEWLEKYNRDRDALVERYKKGAAMLPHNQPDYKPMIRDEYLNPRKKV